MTTSTSVPCQLKVETHCRIWLYVCKQQAKRLKRQEFKMNQDEKMIEDQNLSLGQPLSDFLQQLEDYTPTIPDAVTCYYLRSSGFEPKDPRLVRLISIAAQKFISDIANDALQHCKMRTTNSSSHSSSKSKQGTKDRRYCLTMEDLTPALAEFGITIKKPHYYV